MNTSLQSAASLIIARCGQLARYTEVPGETTRLHLCPPMRQVHAALRTWMEQAGLAVRLDAAGNLRGRRTAAIDTRRVLLLGSHLDTVPNAGAFDGMLGVLLGLSAIELLNDEQLPYAVELIGFAEEEGVRFGRPFLGSLALVGELDEEILARRDRHGTSVREALLAFGVPLADLPLEELPQDGSIIGFFEVHIEQGPVLEHAGRALGVVRAIAGQTRMRLSFRGVANHAGTTPMALRRDALAAAAAWITDVEQQASAEPGLVATVGQLSVVPGAANVIASCATATLDVRHAVDTTRRCVAQALLAAAVAQAGRRNVELDVEVVLEQSAVAMDEALSSMLGRAALNDGSTALMMTSGAGHDAMVLARRVPAAMLFVRTPNGLSHHPDEAVLPADVAEALAATLRFLRLLGDDETSRTRREG